MAILLDSTGTLNGDAGSVVSWTHTVGAGVTNGIILAYIFDGGTQVAVTNLKYAGTLMTSLKAGTQTGDPFSAEFWYLLNPPTGLGTFNGTFLGLPTGGEYDALSISYGGVNQTTPFAGSAIKIGTSTATGSIAFTSLPANALTVGMYATDFNAGTMITGIQRGTAGSGAMVIGADSTGGTLRFGNNAAANWVIIGGELQAATVGTFPIGFRSLLGVGI